MGAAPRTEGNHRSNRGLEGSRLQPPKSSSMTPVPTTMSTRPGSPGVGHWARTAVSSRSQKWDGPSFEGSTGSIESVPSPRGRTGSATAATAWASRLPRGQPRSVRISRGSGGGSMNRPSTLAHRPRRTPSSSSPASPWTRRYRTGKSRFHPTCSSGRTLLPCYQAVLARQPYGSLPPKPSEYRVLGMTLPAGRRQDVVPGAAGRLRRLPGRPPAPGRGDPADPTAARPTRTRRSGCRRLRMPRAGTPPAGSA
jgi:hypothetical protein